MQNNYLNCTQVYQELSQENQISMLILNLNQNDKPEDKPMQLVP